MTWRTVVISKRAKLDFKMNYMVVRGTETSRVHLSEIGMLIIESTAVSLTAVLLNELLKKRVKIIFCDDKRNPAGELLSYHGCHDASRKIKQQVAWTEDTKAAVWADIVRDKILRQHQVLQRYDIKPEVNLLTYMEEVAPKDVTNREGLAAKVYFQALFGPEFNREDKSPINSALDYGYAILLSACNREIVKNGYTTQLGIFHDNQHNPFNLGSDLMEPFRPIVDKKVKSMDLKGFGTQEKRTLLEFLETQVCMQGRYQYLLAALAVYIRCALEALSSGDVSQLRFLENEL